MKGTKPNLVIDRDAIASTISAPKWLSKEAKAEWRRVFPSLVQRRVLTQSDLGTLENWCVASGRVRELESVIQAAGVNIDPVVLRLQDKAIQTSRQLAAELGLTPVSRSRPSIRDDNPDDDDDNPINIS